MLTPFTELLAEHDRAGSGLGAFTCYDLEVTAGVLAAAAERDVGVVLLISRDALRRARRRAAAGGGAGGGGALAGARLRPARPRRRPDPDRAAPSSSGRGR